MELKDLVKQVKVFNGLKLVPEEIKVAKKDSLETLCRKFVEIVSKTPDTDDARMEKENQEVWKGICATFEEAKALVLGANKLGKPEERPKKGNGKNAEPKTKPTEKSATKKPTEKKEIEKTKFDHRVASQSGMIDIFLEKGGRQDVILKALMKDSGKTEAWAKSRLAGHIKHLSESHKVTIDSETLKLK